LARYHADGSRDSAFGSGGVATLGIDSCGVALVAQTDGKLVASLGFELIRYVPPSCSIDAECPACQVCRAGECTLGPRADCRRPIVSGASRLLLRRPRTGGGDRLVWRWSRGTATSVAAFGDPRTTDDYTLCMFGDGGRLFEGRAPAGAMCGAHRPCWTAAGRRGFEYADGKLARNDGLANLTLNAGRTGKARIVLKGKGHGLSTAPAGLPALPLDLPLTVQLQGAGQCWGARFSLAGTRKNTAGSFKSTSD
jgi:hypothetical protein